MEPNFTFYVIDFFVIMAACMAAAWAEDRFRAWKHKDLDIGCDNEKCGLPLPLKRTPDKKHWLCRSCMKAYIAEHEVELLDAGITADQIRKASSGYRRRKRTRAK